MIQSSYKYLLFSVMRKRYCLTFVSSFFLATGCSPIGVDDPAGVLLGKTLLGSLLVNQTPHPSPSPQAPTNHQVFTFSFNAFGDSGWADTHVPRPAYREGFKRAYRKFDPDGRLIADLNYINWETSVGNYCSSFWSRPSGSTYAFLTRPEELADAVSTGFNLVGLANNHTYDCLSSPEGVGPLQTYAHVARLQKDLDSRGQSALFSGVFKTPESEVPTFLLSTAKGKVPVRFISAYVGGDSAHCRHILCDQSIERYSGSMASQTGLRILALHSWDSSSHRRLKTILHSWLSRGLVDVAIGTGPHVAESVSLVQTPRGPGILATSLGNFIHPSLSPQPNNIALQTIWTFDAAQKKVLLSKVSTTTISCDGSFCRLGSVRNYVVPIARQ